MRLNLRCTEAHVTPSDASGFLVEIEVADAEDAREQMLRGPDDAADDWPLAKRYGEIVDASARAVAERDGERAALEAARAEPEGFVDVGEMIEVAAAEARRGALEEVEAALWTRSENEEYGHAKAAVMLDIEAVRALATREEEKADGK